MESDRNDGHKPKLLVPLQPNIGIDSDSRHSVVDILNHSLANEAVLTLHTRSAYWNVSGSAFSELQTLFKSQYQILNTISDEIAERVRMLGGVAICSFKEFLNHTRLEEQPGIAPDVMDLLANHEAVIRFLREDARKCTEEYEDEGTFTCLVSVLRRHEQMAWMLRSRIQPEILHGESQEGK